MLAFKHISATAARSATRQLPNMAHAVRCFAVSSSAPPAASADKAPAAAAAAEPARPHSTFWERLWSNKWIEPEAEYITYRAYKNHRQLALAEYSSAAYNPPPVSREELESQGTSYTYKPKTIGDHVARSLVRALIPFNHVVFRDRYNHHACVLETVAAVPGMVGAMFRHLKSLRSMNRDNGWINPLLEEAENERMHLLTWMQITQPTPFEKMLVLSAQAIYWMAYAGMYIVAPRVAHRFVGYLEEEAVLAYTEYLAAIDKGTLPNSPAPAIARSYWNLPENATVRDVVLFVRADECMHRNANHHFAELYIKNGGTSEPMIPPRELCPPPNSSSSASSRSK